MRVLVTGGAGFIGSNLVRRLLERGDEVRVFDNFSTGSRDNLAGLEPELVFHQGARTSVPLSVQDPQTTFSINVAGTRNVLVGARDEEVRRVILASSSSVYGDSGSLPRKESATPAPISPYAVSKLVAEHYGSGFSRMYPIETVMLRYFNAFGPSQACASRYAAVIPRFLEAVEAGEPVPIHGDGTQLRDFTYVTDVVEANVLASEASGVSGEVVNVAAGRPQAINRLVEILGDVLGRDIERQYLPARPGDVRDSWADIELGARLLGYEPRVCLEDGLRLTADAFLGGPLTDVVAG